MSRIGSGRHMRAVTAAYMAVGTWLVAAGSVLVGVPLSAAAEAMPAAGVHPGVLTGGASTPTSLLTVAALVIAAASLGVALALVLRTRRRAEAVLRAHEFSLQAVSHPTMVLDRDRRVVSANRATVTALGVPLEQILGRSCHELFHRTGAPAGGCPLEVLLATGKEATLEVSALNGRFLVLCTPLVDAEGQVERIVHVAIDVTAQRRETDELRRERDQLRTWFDAVESVLVVLDDKGVVVAANQGACSVLGYTADRLRGADWFETCVPERLRPALQATFQAALGGRVEHTAVVEHPVVTAYRDERLIAWHRQVLRDPAGRPVGVACAGEDVTEARRAAEASRILEARVQQVQRVRNLASMAAGIAHGFNNLLTGILGNTDLALRELPADSPAVDCLRDTVKASRRAAEMCQQLLAYSGGGQFVVEPVSLSQLIRDMLPKLEPAAPSRATLRCDMAHNLPAVEADAPQLRQVIANLVANASEALGDDSGQITVSTGVMECDEAWLRCAYLGETCTPGVYVYLEVLDTGCGMDRQTQARMFDPFFSTRLTGRGLGLSAVLGIVRGHRGAVQVSSDPGHGTRVRVLLPASDRLPSADTPTEEDEDWVGSGTVLLVDDEETVRSVTTRMLTRCGFRVLPARDRPEAVRLFREQSAEIVCVILNLGLPRSDGPATFEELRGIRADVPVILSGGRGGEAEQELIRRVTGGGLAGFIRKPYRIPALMSKLRTALASGVPVGKG